MPNNSSPHNPNRKNRFQAMLERLSWSSRDSLDESGTHPDTLINPEDLPVRQLDIPPAPPKLRPTSQGPEYHIFLARYVGSLREDGQEADSLERGRARLVRVDKGLPGVGPRRGIRPLIFFSCRFGELWLDSHFGSGWREFIFLQEINRAQWERLIITEGLLPDALRKASGIERI